MRPEIDETLLTAYALGELDARERGRVAAHLAADGEARRYVEEVRETAGLVTDQLALEPAGGLTARQREVIERRLRQLEGAGSAAAAGASGAPLRIGPSRAAVRLRQWLPLAASLAASIAIVCGSLAVLLPWMYPRPVISRGVDDDGDGRPGDDDGGNNGGLRVIRPGDDGVPRPLLPGHSPDGAYARDPGATNALPGEGDVAGDDPGFALDDWEPVAGMQDPRSLLPRDEIARQDPPAVEPERVAPAAAPAPNPASPERVATAVGPAASEAEDLHTGDNDKPGPAVAPPGSPGTGYVPRDSAVVSVPDPAVFPEVVKNDTTTGPAAPKIYENPFRLATHRPRSAFPVRVETRSYKVVRSNLLERKLPPAHLVRIEELVNRFRYGYAPPADPDAALVATAEVAACPWNVRHRLARVAVKAREGGATVVARGVEVAVEFNPLATARWRLIGYENAPAPQPRPGAFAADLAAAGTATAFYEIVPVAGADARGGGAAAARSPPRSASCSR